MAGKGSGGGEGFSIEVEGGEALLSYLTRSGDEAVKALSQAMHEQALIAFARSQREVPRRTGVLAASGKVASPQVRGETVEVTLGYGGAASEYAMIVHENLEANHSGGTKAKYLEDPVRQQMQALPDAIAKRMGELLGGAR